MKPLFTIGFSLLGLLMTAGSVVAVVRLAKRERSEPSRCSPGLVANGPRCCPPGQRFDKGRCSGTPASCPSGMHVDDGRSGCVVDPRRVPFRGGALSIGVEDWQAEGVVTPRRAVVPPFLLDGAEVTFERWLHCVRAGACRALDDIEPGAPVTAVEPKEAERFCRFEQGRLPTSDEWLFAAMGTEARRFPWGPTGLSCHRAAFGLSVGPCAAGGGPELSGARPDGATPDGVLDMSGNVAEWTVERDGRYVARGGSFLSRTALELKTWAAASALPRARDVGFRCAFDAQGSRSVDR